MDDIEKKIEALDEWKDRESIRLNFERNYRFLQAHNKWLDENCQVDMYAIIKAQQALLDREKTLPWFETMMRTAMRFAKKNPSVSAYEVVRTMYNKSKGK